MSDRDCIEFLQWALPRLQLRWPGFRRVRRQVCKRIAQRMADLRLHSSEQYRAHLETQPAEWAVLDSLCRITISRFYRDRGVFDYLREQVLPVLASRREAGTPLIRCWSAGCASGEEAYTLALIWTFALAPSARGVEFEVIATDIDQALLQRAHQACYPWSSLRELPVPWIEQGFQRVDGNYCLVPELRQHVHFRLQDIRHQTPVECFQLVLCRNLVFTYFDEPMQRQILARLCERLLPGGVLLIGCHEALPSGHPLEQPVPSQPVYWKSPH